VSALAALLVLGACKQDAAPAAGAEPAAAPAAKSAVENAAAALNPLPDAKADVKAAMAKFMAAKSYHASVQMQGGQRAMNSEMDFVAPDRMRMDMPGLGQQVIVGDTMYMNVKGKSLKVPMQPGTMTQWRDPAKLEENAASMRVQAQGRDTVDGVSTRKYLVHSEQPQPSDVTMWIGDDGLPRKMQMAGGQNKMGDVTVLYSRYDDPSIKIEAPQP